MRIVFIDKNRKKLHPSVRGLILQGKMASQCGQPISKFIGKPASFENLNELETSLKLTMTIIDAENRLEKLERLVDELKKNTK